MVWELCIRCVVVMFCVFFFFKQKTAYEMRISDWSSDVCSSDLIDGPGLSAALSSALLGTINGSAVANVVTTGTFTIPLMKRVGYTPTPAAAIEAPASSAGQILPPVMGVAAFLMADIMGLPYPECVFPAMGPPLPHRPPLFLAAPP